MMCTEPSGNDVYQPVDRVAAPHAARRSMRAALAISAGLVAGVWTAAWHAAPARADESLQQRAERVEQMSDADKAVLLQKYHRFDKLEPAEQERLREFHNQLSQDPDEARLRQVLTQYHNWLNTLTPLERAEILDLPPDKRIEKIKELTRAQDERRFRRMAGGYAMSPRDLTTIHDWFDEFLDQHAQEIIQTLPDGPFGPLAIKKDYHRERDRVQLGWLYIQSMSPDLPRPSEEEEQQLQTRLSKIAQEVLNQAGSAQARSRIIRWWISAAVLSRFRSGPSTDELHKFAQESLSERERSRLENLPVEQMHRELRSLFFQHRFAGDRSRGFPWGPPGGDRKPGPEGEPGFGPPPPGGREGPGPPPPPGAGPGAAGESTEPPPGRDPLPPAPAKSPDHSSRLDTRGGQEVAR